MSNISINEFSNETSIDNKFVDFFEHWESKDYIHMAMGAGAVVLTGLTMLCIKSCYKSCRATPYNSLSALELAHHSSAQGDGPSSVIKVDLKEGGFNEDASPILGAVMDVAGNQ
jgi:hypothetical protein